MNEIPNERVECFHPGQVWQSSKGAFYRVVEAPRNGQAVLRKGIDGQGRIVRRNWDAVLGWTLAFDPKHGWTPGMQSIVDRHPEMVGEAKTR